MFTNSFFIKIFNKIYFLKNRYVQKKIINYEEYFYPLDKIKNWNFFYGKNGFIQLHCLIPFSENNLNIKKILNEINLLKVPVYLCVMKLFKKEIKENSFTGEGISLALDIKNNDKSKTLCKKIYQLLIKFNGKVYLSKDSNLSKEDFIEMYPYFTNLLKFRNKNDMNIYSSEQLERLIK